MSIISQWLFHTSVKLSFTSYFVSDLITLHSVYIQMLQFLFLHENAKSYAKVLSRSITVYNMSGLTIKFRKGHCNLLVNYLFPLSHP